MQKQFLKKLLETPTPSGLETLGLKAWEDEMSAIGNRYYQDKSGNLAFSLGTGPVKVLLSGHIDEICMAVRFITKDGFLVPTGMGGIDKKVLPGRNVLVMRGYDVMGGTIEGIVHKPAIHIEYGEEKLKEKAYDLDDMRIDIGAESKEEIIEEYGIRIGSLIVPGRHINLEFGKTKLHGNSLDDKAGVFVVSEVLRNLSACSGEWETKYTIIGLACTGEESGLLGAHRAAHQINPDISIDLDVTHANHGGQYPEEKYGDIKLGSGVVLEYGQDKSRRLNSLLRKVAVEGEIKTQDSVSRIGGTNTAKFYLESADAETTLLSLPLLSMHTPVETMDWRDIKGAIDLLTKAILGCKL